MSRRVALSPSTRHLRWDEESMEDFAFAAATGQSAATIDIPRVLHVSSFDQHVLNCTSYTTDRPARVRFRNIRPRSVAPSPVKDGCVGGPNGRTSDRRPAMGALNRRAAAVAGEGRERTPPRLFENQTCRAGIPRVGRGSAGEEFGRARTADPRVSWPRRRRSLKSERRPPESQGNPSPPADPRPSLRRAVDRIAPRSASASSPHLSRACQLRETGGIGVFLGPPPSHRAPVAGRNGRTGPRSAARFPTAPCARRSGGGGGPRRARGGEGRGAEAAGREGRRSGGRENPPVRHFSARGEPQKM
jgi:hypothetical protein